MSAPLDLAAVKADLDTTRVWDGEPDPTLTHARALVAEVERLRAVLAVETDDGSDLRVEVERLAAENARLLDNLRAWRDPVCDAIRARLSEISEENWRAGWLRDIEHCVWRDITTGSRDECFGDVTAASLKALSEIIGGWVYWPADSDSPAFVALDEWTAIHAEWLKTKAALRAAGGG